MRIGFRVFEFSGNITMESERAGEHTMKISVLVEPRNGTGFRARTGEPFDITVDGATREAALQNLKEQVQTRIQNGAEIVPVEVGNEAHPWLAFAGMFKDDPMLNEWKQAMADYRDQVDKDDDYR